MARLSSGHLCATYLLRRLLYLVLASVMALLLSLTSSFISLAQLVNYLVFHKTAPQIQRFINSYLQDALISQITVVSEWYFGHRIRVYFANKKTLEMLGQEHALIIGNHAYQIDSIFYWLFGQMTNILGPSKAYVKDSLRWMPVLGWAFYFGEFIFLKRNWKEDLENIGPALDTFMESKMKPSILLFPEGTRYTKEKHAASLVFAQERNIPYTYKHHLLPRVKGFVFTLRYLQKKYPEKFAIYNLEVIQRQYPDAPEPNLKNFLKGKSFLIDFYCERIESSDLPPVDATDEEYSDFVFKLFEKKDQLIEDYNNYSLFPRSYLFPKQLSVFRLIQFLALNLGLSGSLVLYLTYIAITTHSLLLRSIIYGFTILTYSGFLLVLFLMQNSKYGAKSKSKSRTKPAIVAEDAVLSSTSLPHS